jgi:MFS family permease
LVDANREMAAGDRQSFPLHFQLPWGWLVAMRCLQALDGCAAQVASMAMVRDFFPVHETARIISLLILILGGFAMARLKATR